jgi:hypothetical protein
MLRRTLRYTLLVLTLLLAVMWAWSYADAIGVRLGGWSIVSDRGSLTLVKGETVSNAVALWPYSLRSPNNVVYYNHFTCPTGLMVLPLVVVTAWVWYRPLRDRRSRKTDIGFAVRPIPSKGNDSVEPNGRDNSR